MLDMPLNKEYALMLLKINSVIKGGVYPSHLEC